MSQPFSNCQRIYEKLAAAKDISEAIHMACDRLDDDMSKCAIQAVADCLKDHLSAILTMVEEVQEELR